MTSLFGVSYLSGKMQKKGHPNQLSVDNPCFTGSSLVTGHVSSYPFPEASPDPNLTLTQTLDLTQGRVGMWPATEQGPFWSTLPGQHNDAYCIMHEVAVHFRGRVGGALYTCTLLQ